MKIAVRDISNRIGLSVAAFVLAVSSLVAIAPTALQASASGFARVTDEASLLLAAADRTVTTISLDANVQTTQKVVFSGRSVYIDGNNRSITMVGNNTAWDSNYVIQAYGISFGTKNLKVSGGDAAIYVNGSTYNVQGMLDVTGNHFGGIEVSQGVGVTSAAVLNAASATVINSSEVNTKPTAWTDKASSANAAVNGAFTKTTHIGANQHQYYLQAVNAGVVATNVTNGTTYGDAQLAINAATAGNEIRLDADLTITGTALRVNKAITLNGNGKTVTTPAIRGSGADNLNAAVVVSESGATVTNLNTVSTHSTNPRHGIVIGKFSTVHISGITLANVTAVGGTAGVIVNNATATIDGITTSASKWYGVGVDKGAHVTIKGANSHDETQHLKNDSTTQSSITDTANQYVKIKIDATHAYHVLNNIVPVASVTVKGATDSLIAADGAGTKALTVTGSATAPRALKQHWFEITAPNGTNYYAYSFGGTSSHAFALQDVAGIPVNGNGLLLSGVYKIRYVATDVTGVRSDANGTVTRFTLTVDQEKPVVTSVGVTPSPAKGSDDVRLNLQVTDAQTRVVSAKYDLYDAADNRIQQGTPVTGVFGTSTVSLSHPIDVSGLASGVYRVQLFIYDAAGNMQKKTTSFTVNNEVIVSIDSITEGSSTPTIRGQAFWSLDSSEFAHGNLALTVDGIVYPVATDANGKWTVSIPTANAFEDGTYTAVVTNARGAQVTSETFTVTVTADIQNEAPVTPITPAVFPTAVAQLPITQVLGASTQGNGTANNVANTPRGEAETKGASTENKVSQAVDSDENKGIFLGLAWYWWILIVAGVALVSWWIVAAIRNRKSEA